MNTNRNQHVYMPHYANHRACVRHEFCLFIHAYIHTHTHTANMLLSITPSIQKNIHSCPIMSLFLLDCPIYASVFQAIVVCLPLQYWDTFCLIYYTASETYIGIRIVKTLAIHFLISVHPS